MRTDIVRTQSVNFDDIYKLPRSFRYFNISVIWIAYYPAVIRLFYRLGIRHEVATGLSLLTGLVAGGLIVSADSPMPLIAAAILVHLKDLFDATDGALARLTGTGHRFGRFLDTIGDGVVFTVWILAVAWHGLSADGDLFVIVWPAALTWVSLFLQCTYFNYHQLHYQRLAGVQSASSLDERIRTTSDSRATQIIHGVYKRWFGWQDRLIARFDAAQRTSLGLPHDPNDTRNDTWFGHRGFMTANSSLCFGTHAFILILALLVSQPIWFIPTVMIGMNLYWLGIVLARRIVFRRVRW